MAHPLGNILIADRNRHVRELLRRELAAEGYQVEVVRDGRELLIKLDGEAPPQLLILDLELPYLDDLKIWERLKDYRPPLPVVIYTFLPEYPTYLTAPQTVTFVEKTGDTDQLKSVVAEVIKRSHSRGVAAAQETVM